MNEETKEMETPTNEGVETSVETSEVKPIVDDKAVKTALAQKDHWREKAEKIESEKRALEEQLNNIQKSGVKAKGLDIEDYIDISTSLEGLDQREKEYLAKEHKLTGKPLTEIRENEDFKLWQSAYQAKVAKEKATLAPSATQSETDRPVTITERLSRAISIEEKQKILEEAGLYKNNRPRADRTNIGSGFMR